MDRTQPTAEIWKEFSGQIRTHLLRKVEHRDDADDLLQEIFIKIHSRLGDLKDEKKLAHWINQIVRNSLTDYYRKNGLRTSEFDEESSVSSDTPEDSFYTDLSGCLNVFIDRLPEKYREPLILSDIKGMKQKDIAKQMNLSYSGLKSRVQRGRDMIKDMFMECACVTHDENGKIVGEFHGNENCEICNPPAN